MTNTVKVLAFALASVAAAVAGIGWADHAAQPTTQVVKLERVVIVGKRVDTQAPVVALLPRVVVEGRRAARANDLQIASAKRFHKAS